MYIYMNVYMTKESNYSELLLNKYNKCLFSYLYIYRAKYMYNRAKK